MTWSYSTAQTTAKDKVRFMVGDNDNDRQLISDEEINAVLARQSNNVIRSTIEIAEHLEAKFVRRAESRSGEIIADFLTVAGKYRDLARRLKKKVTKGYWLDTVDSRDSDREDTSIVHPAITFGGFDNPES